MGNKAAVKIIRNAKPKVKELLTKSKFASQYRDDDELLVARYWKDEIIAKNGGHESQKAKDLFEAMTARQFLDLYIKGELTPADAITRARRIIQEKFPDARGEKWNERHGKAADVKKNLPVETRD